MVRGSKWLDVCLSLAFTFSVGVAAASAQSSVHASLSGRVDDPSGGAVADATVTLASPETGATYVAETDAGGQFAFVRISPGRYRVEATQEGFGTARREIALAVNDTAVISLALPLANVDTSVTVEAAARPLDRSPAVSTVVRREQIRDLPLNSRDFQRLMELAPGMSTGGTRGTLANPSVSGTRNSSNNYVIDGMTANEERQLAGLAPGNDGLIVPNVISTEALEEFRVVTSNADATFGRGAGAQINVITRSGTNRFQGSAYEFHRNERLDARDFFNNGPYFDDRGQPKPPPLSYNLFGGTVGGPLKRNGHFFFLSLEGFRQDEKLSASAVQPNRALIELIPGDLGRLFRTAFLDSGFIPRTGHAGEFRSFSPAERSAAVAAGFPAHLFDGNAANEEAGVVVANVSNERIFDQNATLLRTDHRLSDRVTASVRYAWTRSTFERYLGRPGTRFDTTRDFQSGLGQIVATLTTSQLLEVRGGWLRTDAPVKTLDVDPAVAALGMEPTNLQVTGTTAFVLPNVSGPLGFIEQQTTPQVSALHTWVRGGWTIRSGADLRRVKIDFANLSLGRPTYQFTGLVGPNGLLGASPSQTQSVASVYTATIFGGEGAPPSPQRVYRSMQQEYFVQGDWRATSRLTLNVGLRYAIFGVYDINGVANLYAVDAQGNTVPDVSPLTFGRNANRLESGRPLYKSDYDNLQPRLGVAWDASGSGKTIFKGAYGLYHDRFFQFGFANIATNVPFAVSGSVSQAPFQFGAPPAISPRTPSVFAIDPSIENPYFHRVSVGVDQEIARNTVVSASYVGSFGRDLARIVDINFAGAFPQAQRPDPRFADVRLFTNYSTSKYNALQMAVRSSPSAALNLTLAYTYSRLTDFAFPDTIGATTPVPSILTNTGAREATGFQVGPFVDRPVESEAGRSDQDVPHVLSVSHILQLPVGRGRRWLSSAPGAVDAMLGGWSIAGLLRARSGAPVNITLGRDINDDGDVTDRPALLNGSLDDLRATGGARTQYFVPQAEALTLLGVPADVSDPLGRIPYNALRGPAVWSYDLSLQKRFALGRTALQVEANAFNLFNRTNLGTPNGSLSSALFGTIAATAPGFGPRQLQLGAKLTF